MEELHQSLPISCGFCRIYPVIQPKYPGVNAGDVVLVFDNGAVYKMPDIVLHYIADHGWLPAPDVTLTIHRARYIEGQRGKATKYKRIGYLGHPVQVGFATGGFRQKLEAIFALAKQNGDWQPTED